VKIALEKQSIHTGLSQVTVPRSEMDTMRVTHINKEELEMACLKEARRHFIGSSNTYVAISNGGYSWIR